MKASSLYKIKHSGCCRDEVLMLLLLHIRSRQYSLFSAEGLHVLFRFAKSHPGGLFLDRISRPSELRGNLGRGIAGKKLLEQTHLVLCPQTLNSFLFCFLFRHFTPPFKITRISASCDTSAILVCDVSVIKHFSVVKRKKITFSVNRRI